MYNVCDMAYSSVSETLLGQLSVYLKQLRDDFIHRTGSSSQGVPKGKNLPETVNNIVWVRQLEAKVTDNHNTTLPIANASLNMTIL